MRRRAQQLSSLIALLAMLASAVAGLVRSQPPEAPPAPPAEPAAASPRPPPSLPAMHGDLSDIRFRREFRILVAPPAASADPLDRADQHQHVRQLIERFADEQFLLPRWVRVERRAALAPALLAGHGDIIGTPMQIPALKSRGLAFSVPVDHLREVLIVRAGERIRRRRDLRGREIALGARSTFWPELNALRKEVPDVTARIVPHGTAAELILQRVQGGEYDTAVVDPGPVELGVGRWAGLRAVKSISSGGNLSLALRPDAVELKEALDDFLTREQLVRRELPRRTVDLPGIKRSGVLRVLTRNNAGTYFVWRGKPLGFEYELVSRFADEHGLSVEMIIAGNRRDLLPALARGEADMVAAGLTVTPRKGDSGIAYTRPYLETWQEVVTRAADATLTGPADLEGRTVTVRESSPVWTLLQGLVEQGARIKLKAAPEDLEAEELIARVADGVADVTVADAYSVKVALTWRDDVRSAFAIDGPTPVAWAVRRSNPALLQALNEFIEREYRQLFYNIIHSRYFENPRSIRSHIEHRVDGGLNGAQLSPYDEIVQRHAAEHGFDWPLIVALMYRESRFDPEVVSWAGARGLMQMLPVTAERFGVTDLNDPEKSIRAGIRMLAWLFRQLEPELPVKDRTWFALAAYNAGLGHLLDARELAREQGLDPDQWFDNVEKAMLLLSKRAYYRKARHGYVRGIEPVTYVRDIRSLYNAYRAMLP